ncbi:MAG TPA: DUF5947 family protein [Polyangiaceae bacterium]|nr:DUF5947 family protein [Polyangiaceae bacterium]
MTIAGVPRALSALRRFARREETPDPCDLCGLALEGRHDHLLDPAARRIACACRACSLLFPEGGGARFRRIRSRAQLLRGEALTDDHLAALGVPVRLFYLCPSRIHDTVFAVYPNAAGATEAKVALPAWEALLRDRPALSEIQPEVEGLLCDQLSGRSRCFLASVDVCRHFVGLLGGRRTPSDALRFLDAIEGSVV